mmetsp:Transcript_26215/g.33997  ORF Transcript_26215/g.33997 Transcript_26215/m.33997 type:complete len:1147 (+) Transcript_26215:145-3585(+)
MKRSESLTHRTTSRQSSLNEEKPFQRQRSSRTPRRQRSFKESQRGDGSQDKPTLATACNFKYNYQVWAVVAPCLVVLGALGGQPALLAGTLGLMCTYTLDIAQVREGTIVGVWMTLLLSCMAVGVASSSAFSVSWIMGFLRLATYIFFFVLLGLWATLQFQWLVALAPESAIMLERLLLVCLPIPAASIITSGAVVYVGPRHAPFMFAAALYYCLNQLAPHPLLTSFQPQTAQKGDAKPKDKAPQPKIHGSRDAALLSLSLLVLPVLLHIAFHHAEVFGPPPKRQELDGSSGYEWGFGMSGVRIALALPIVLSWTLVSKGAFWWTGMPQETLETVWKVLGVGAIFTLIYEMEQAVLLDVFRPYIDVRAPYDFIYLIALTGMVMFSAFMFMMFGELKAGDGSSKGPMVVVVAMNMGAAYLLCELFGSPATVKLEAQLAALSLALFLFQRALWEYVVFVVCGGLWLAWFASDTLGFLQFYFAIGLSVRTYTLALTVVAMVGAFLPALVWLKTGPGFLGFILVVYTSGVAIVEVCLVDGAGKLYEPLEAYPILFLLTTSVVGIWVSCNLRAQGVLGPLSYWYVACLSLGKLVAVVAVFWLKTFGATGSLIGTLLPAVASLLALSAAHVFDDPAAANAATPGAGATAAAKTAEARKLPVLSGVAHFVTVGLALSQAAEPVLQPLLTLIFTRTPSLATLAGCVVLIWGLSLLSMVSTFFPGSLQGRRLAALMIFSAVLLQLIQPELRPGHILSSLTQPLAGDNHELNWAPLCLFAASLVMLVGSMGITRVPQSKPGRLVYTFLLGIPLGLYIALSALQEPQTMMMVCYAVMTSCLVFILVCVLSPNTNCDNLVILMFFLFLGTGLAAYAEQTYLYFYYLDVRNHSKSLVLSQEIQALFALSAVGSLIVAVALKSLGAGAARRKPGSSRRSTPTAARGAMVEGSSPWIPFIGNMSALYAFVASISYVHSSYSLSSAAVISPFLCSILLLLQKDQGFFKGLTEERMLGPMVLGCWAILFGSAVYSLLVRGMGSSEGQGTNLPAGDVGARLASLMESEEWKEFSLWTSASVVSPLWHGGLALGCLPSFGCLLRYTWNHRSASGLTLATVAPLCLVALLLSSLTSVNMLGLAGFVGSLFQYFSTSQHHLQSMQYI